MSKRTYGRIWFSNGFWRFTCDPHVAGRAKRLFAKIPNGSSTLEIKESEDVCADLQWFLQRYPMEIQTEDYRRLQEIVRDYEERIDKLDDIISGNYEPREFKLAFPPREYQRVAADVFLSTGSLILADDVGLGKTITIISALTDPKMLPALVVVPPQLQGQWKDELKKFAPQLKTHVIARSTPYPLPQGKNGRTPDVLICSYHKLHGWVSVFKKYISTVAYDEIHELRRTESDKYRSAKSISDAAQYRIGASATVIHNYGGEIFNVVECIRPGALGDNEEFVREWCIGESGKKIVKDPEALGSFMKREHLMIRRSKKDVGRELPDVVTVHHTVDSNQKKMKAATGKASELAKIILNETESRYSSFDVMRASQELSVVMRQATGIAKAEYVAEFVRMLIEGGEPVLLAGWHRAVYQIWLEKLSTYHPAMYTGSESPTRKQQEKERFVNGETPLMIMSLRSGVGVDGLQHACKTVCFGELDWSPAVHEQFVGRISRDGNEHQVTAYYLVSNDGIDPEMAEILGVKEGQLRGLQGEVRSIQKKVDTGEIVRRVAARYFNQRP